MRQDLNENFHVKIKIFTKWDINICVFCRSDYNLVYSKSLPFHKLQYTMYLIIFIDSIKENKKNKKIKKERRRHVISYD